MKGKDNNRELTRAELEVMQVIWRKGRAVMGEIVDDFPQDDRPAYTTISTVVRILEKKGFVGHESYGKVHCYHPLVSREEYRGNMLSGIMNNLFDNSPLELMACFADSGKLTVEQYEKLRGMIEDMATE